MINQFAYTINDNQNWNENQLINQLIVPAVMENSETQCYVFTVPYNVIRMYMCYVELVEHSATYLFTVPYICTCVMLN